MELEKALLPSAKYAGKVHGFTIHDMYLNIIAEQLYPAMATTFPAPRSRIMCPARVENPFKNGLRNKEPKAIDLGWD